MYAELLPILRCPTCGAHPLTLLGPLTDAYTGEITAGALHCDQCHQQTAIRDGIWDALTDAPLPRTPAQLTNYLPLTARVYERGWRWLALTLMSGRHFPLREELTLMHELVQPQPDRVYVDVACSEGLYARALAHSGAIVAGVDHSWAFVRQARQRALDHGLRISYIRAAAEALPFADGTATGVVMGGSLNELTDQQVALHEIRRILQPQGRFFSMNLVAARSAWGRALQRALSTGGIVFPSLKTLAAWFDAALLAPRAQWNWRVVAITLLKPAEAAQTATSARDRST